MALDYVKTRREDVKPIPVKQQGLIHTIMKWYTRFNVSVFKLSRGRLMKRFPGGYPICVVGTTGARSGKRREVALIYLPWGDKVLLVASQGGMEKHPFWYYNVLASPRVDILYGGTTRHLTARQASDDEKRDLWPHLLTLYPDFDEYQARTDRNIPVFICE